MKKILSVIAILSLVFLPVTPAFADVSTWTGATSALFNDNNWSGTNNPPLTGDSLVFTSATGVGGLTLNNDLVGFSFAGITYNSGAAAFDIGGNAFSLTGDIVNNSTSLETISVGTTGITLSGAGRALQTTTTGGITVSSAIENGGFLLTTNAAASSTITLSGNITGTGGLDKTGTGTLTLSGAANTYSGGATLDAGTLNFNSTTAIGATAGAFTINAGTLDNTSGAAITNANANAITIGGNFSFSTSSGTSNNNLNLGTGAITNAGNRTIAVNGTTTTLTMGGIMTNTSGAIQTTTVNGAGNTLSLGGYALSNDATSRIDVINGNGNVTITGAVTNGGTATASGLTYSGSATLTLSGNNTYDGLTTISSGTAILSGDNSGASGGVTLASGATLKLGSATSLGATAGTFTINGGTIDTSGGAQTLTTNNAQTWGGDFTFTGTNNLNLGTGAVTLGATRQVTVSANTLTVGGAIGDGGNTYGLTKTGAGTLTLSGASTYTGATTVSAGTLKAGVVTNAFGSNSAVTMANVASATLDITGFNNSIGSLTGGGTTGGNVTLGAATLTIGGDNTSPSAYSGVISGTGSVTKTGTGTLTFGNANTYSGTTSVNAGTLAYSNSVSAGSDHTVGASGTLSLGTNTLTLGAGKAYTQTGAGTLNLTINGSSFGSIDTSSTGGTAAVMAGANVVNVTVASYLPNGATYTIVNTGAQGIGTAPTSITSSSNVVSFSPSGASGNLVLTVNRSGTDSAVASAGSNTQAAWTNLEKAGTNGATGDMLNVLNTLDALPSGQAVATAVATMTPDVSSGSAEASRAMTGNSFTMISNRLGGARNVSAGSGVSSGDMLNGVGVWIQGLGSHMKQDERKGIQGFSANTWGTTIGADKVIDNHFRAGFAGSYGWSGVHSKQPGSPSDDINSYQATIYGSYDSLDLCKARQGGKKSPEAVRTQEENSWYVDGMLAFTQNDYDSRREIWLTPSTQRVAKAERYGQQYSTNFEAGYTFVFEETKALEVTPFASLGYNYLYMNSYKENGAGDLNLRVNGNGFNQLEQGLGTKLAYPIVAKKVGTFIPSAKAAWLYDYIGDRFETTASFAGGGSAFNTQGAKPSKNGMLFGAELAFLNKGNVTVTGNWDIQLKDQFVSNTYYGTVRYDF